MADLLGADEELAEIHKLYECHEQLLVHKKNLFSHLTQRWKDLFNAKVEVLLYDLTSTYCEIPADNLMVTHVNRNPTLCKQAVEFARAGGSIDLTTMQRPETHHPQAIPAARAIRDALAAGVPAARMTLSTDSGVPYPQLDVSGNVVGLYMAGPDAILATIRELVEAGVSWGSAAAFATAHTAAVLG